MSLAGIKPLAAKAAGINESKDDPLSSIVTSEGVINEQGLFAPGFKTKTCKEVFWYKCIATKDGKEKIYYRSKEQISADIKDLICKLKTDKNFFSTKITNIKEINKIEELFEFEPEPSVLASADESDDESEDEKTYLKTNKIKTPEEFEKLLKCEKAEYLASPKSYLIAKMRCHSNGANLFEYNTSQFHTLLTSRFENYFKDLFVENSDELKKPVNKEFYNEYMEYFCNLYKAIEKFMEDSELCEIYKKIYEILNN